MNTPSRWQLNRAGIINVYQYENETLKFGGGRLLLRGVNGSGKSTAMNMLLPFLLTGNARGIDAAGEQTGVLRSWMLSGREELQPVGYLWLEFARSSEHSAAQTNDHGTSNNPDSSSGKDAVEYLTIGCGIKANQASSTVKTWWFITSRRPGIDFRFVEQGIPLSIDSLRSVLISDPVYTHDRRSEYRQAIRQKLFGGADISAFLDLINTVRSPRVGDRIDQELPEYLADSLPDLSERALTDAARPLDDLDEHRRNVNDLESTLTGLSAIEGIYRNYVLTDLSSRMVSARTVLAAGRKAHRHAKRTTAELELADEKETESRNNVLAIEEELNQRAAEINALEQSSAYTEGQQLEDLRVQVNHLKDQHQQYEHRHSQLMSRQVHTVNRLQDLEQRTNKNWSTLRDELEQLARSAKEVMSGAQVPVAIPLSTTALATEHQLNELMDTYPGDDVTKQLQALLGSVQQRKIDVGLVREQRELVTQCEQSLLLNKRFHDEAVAQSEASMKTFQDRRAALEAARSDWDDAVAQWLEHAPNSQPYTDQMADRQARRVRLEDDIQRVVDEVQLNLANAQSAEMDAASRVNDAKRELEELNEQKEPAPPLHTWQQRKAPAFSELIDFHSSVPMDVRARLEGALEASGLLAASIGDGPIQLDDGELLLLPQRQVEHPLSDYIGVTIPQALEAHIQVEQVQRVLDGISTTFVDNADTTDNTDKSDSVNTSGAVITVKGEFRLGNLSGRFIKSTAEYIGSAARLAHLERLRAEAAEILIEAQTEWEGRQSELARLKAKKDQVQQVQKQLPSLRPVDRAELESDTAEQQLDDAKNRCEEALLTVNDAEKRLLRLEDDWQRQCRTLSLPVNMNQIDEVDRTLTDISHECPTAVRTTKALALACTDWASGADEWRDLQRDILALTEQRKKAQDVFRTAETRLSTLTQNLGASYQEVLSQIETSQQAKKDAEQAKILAGPTLEDAIRDHQIAKNEQGLAESNAKDCEADCQRTHARVINVLEVPGLLAMLVPEHLSTGSELGAGSESESESELGAKSAVGSGSKNRSEAKPSSINIHTTPDMAGLDELLTSLDQVVNRPEGEGTRADGVRQSLRARRDSLGAGWDAEDRQPDPDYPMSISVNGPLGNMPLAESLTAVSTQLKRLSSLLSEKQDQALRNLLQGLIAKEVAEKMFQARSLIDRMNSHLGKVTSGHGIGVRLRWRQSPELDEVDKTTVEILSKLPDLRTRAEEDVLRESLANRLDEARRLAPDLGYRDLIAEVFDYRQWHEMAVMLRRPGDNEKRLSRRTPLSEGEKKVVTYLPSFAAIAASCDALADSGGPSVPRFILLDDALAKVSEDNHASLFGLLVTLDLDFIATSERLWGTHASVPALNITEVVRDTTLGAILLEHSYWDGQHLRLALATEERIEPANSAQSGLFND